MQIFKLGKKTFAGYFRKSAVISDMTTSSKPKVPISYFILGSSVLDGTDKLK